MRSFRLALLGQNDGGAVAMHSAYSTNPWVDAQNKSSIITSHSIVEVMMLIKNKSRWCEQTLFLLAFIACTISLWQLTLPHIFSLIIMVLLTALFIIAWRRYITLCSSASIEKIQHLKSRQWIVTLRNQQSDQCLLDPRSTCTAALVILLFRVPGQRGLCPVFLIRAQQPAEVWSYLQMKLTAI